MYSDRLMALFHDPVHAGTLAGETHRGVGGTPGGGPYIVLAFRVADAMVREARFQTYGCPAAIACAEAACGWSEGKPVAGLRTVTAADVADWVGGVPEGKEHCPLLTAEALSRVTALG